MGDALTVLRGARLIDGRGGPPIEESVVVLRGERIESVGTVSTARAPADARVVEVTGATILPGLIDAHCHLLGVVSLDAQQWLLDHPSLRAVRAAADAWSLLDSGFTTIRDPAGQHGVFLRAAVDEGSLPGPRVLACGRPLTQTGGHADIAHALPLQWVLDSGFCRIADGPEECRKAVREQARAGADFIKVIASGGVLSRRARLDEPEFTRAELEAIVNEAHSGGLMVAAHAHGAQAVKNAVRAGVDTIEHGTFLDDEAIGLMLERGTYLIPTRAIVERLMSRGASAGLPAALCEKLALVAGRHLASFKEAWRAGVKIGLGTDFFLTPQRDGTLMGDHAVELALYTEAGLSPLEAITCATKVNAEALGIIGEVGTIEPGKLADLIIVDGDPLDDIGLLRDRSRLKDVYRSGLPVPRLQPAEW